MQPFSVAVVKGTDDADHALVREVDLHVIEGAGAAAVDETDPPVVATVVDNQARI